MRLLNTLETDLNTLLCPSPGCFLAGSDTLPVFSWLALCCFWKRWNDLFHQHRFSPVLPLALYPFWLVLYGACVPHCSLSPLS